MVQMLRLRNTFNAELKCIWIWCQITCEGEQMSLCEHFISCCLLSLTSLVNNARRKWVNRRTGEEATIQQVRAQLNLIQFKYNILYKYIAESKEHNSLEYIWKGPVLIGFLRGAFVPFLNWRSKEQVQCCSLTVRSLSWLVNISSNTVQSFPVFTSCVVDSMLAQCGDLTVPRPQPQNIQHYVYCSLYKHTAGAKVIIPSSCLCSYYALRHFERSVL